MFQNNSKATTYAMPACTPRAFFCTHPLTSYVCVCVCLQHDCVWTQITLALRQDNVEITFFTQAGNVAGCGGMMAGCQAQELEERHKGRLTLTGTYMQIQLKLQQQQLTHTHTQQPKLSLAKHADNGDHKTVRLRAGAGAGAEAAAGTQVYSHVHCIYEYAGIQRQPGSQAARQPGTQTVSCREVLCQAAVAFGSSLVCKAAARPATGT